MMELYYPMNAVRITMPDVIKMSPTIMEIVSVVNWKIDLELIMPLIGR